MTNIFSLNNLIAKMKEWYRGEYILPPANDPDSPIVFISPGYYKQPLLAKALKRISKFWLSHWQWVLLFLVGIIGVVATFLMRSD